MEQTIKDYLNNYGPISSIIQKRLRPVYNFSDIYLEQGDNEILIKTKYRDRKYYLLPSDYFSASQINIIALSLFLSVSLTQTWSSFAPILIDDPVTHFDDLNSYSFLDLIKGIILNNKTIKSPQFFISTCDEQLFNLMRNKFKKIDNRVIYYEFNSIGKSGPKYKQSDNQ